MTDDLARLQRLQLYDHHRLDLLNAELVDHRMLAPRKQVYWNYRKLGSTSAVISYLEGRVQRLETRIERREARIKKVRDRNARQA